MSLQVRGSIYHFKEIADHYTGVSIKIEVAYKFEWSNQLYQQGTVSPFFLGGGEGVWMHYAPENFEILKFQSPKMQFSVFWGLNLRTKEHVFH